MSVCYHRRGGWLVPGYLCNRAYMEEGAPICQAIPGAGIDAVVGELLVEAMTPMAVEVALAVQQEIAERVQQADGLRRQQVERARYEVEGARQRYMLVDAANRLVAQTLEADWNEKLRALAEAQDIYERQRREDELVWDESHRQQLLALVRDFPAIWRDPATPHRERKRMVGLLLEDVTLVKLSDITAQVRFRGGATATLKVPLPLNAWQQLKTPDDILAQVDALLENHTDRETVAILNQRGLQTGAGKRFTLTSLRWLRFARGPKSYKQHLQEKGLLTTQEMASLLDVCATTVKNWRRKGIIQARRCADKTEWLYSPPDRDIQNQRSEKKKSLAVDSNQGACVASTAGGAV